MRAVSWLLLKFKLLDSDEASFKREVELAIEEMTRFHKFPNVFVFCGGMQPEISDWSLFLAQDKTTQSHCSRAIAVKSSVDKTAAAVLGTGMVNGCDLTCLLAMIFEAGEYLPRANIKIRSLRRILSADIERRFLTLFKVPSVDPKAPADVQKSQVQQLFLALPLCV